MNLLELYLAIIPFLLNCFHFTTSCKDLDPNCPKNCKSQTNYCLNDGVLDKCPYTCNQCPEKCGDNWNNCKWYRTSCGPGAQPPPFKNGRTLMKNHCKCTCGDCKKIPKPAPSSTRRPPIVDPPPPWPNPTTRRPGPIIVDPPPPWPNPTTRRPGPIIVDPPPPWPNPTTRRPGPIIVDPPPPWNPTTRNPTIKKTTKWTPIPPI